MICEQYLFYFNNLIFKLIYINNKIKYLNAMSSPIFRFLSRLSKQRRADAENKSVAPTLPLPLLNKPSPNIKEVKPPIENQIKKVTDSKTQDIAHKMFPVNKPNAMQTESCKVLFTICVVLAMYNPIFNIII